MQRIAIGVHECGGVGCGRRSGSCRRGRATGGKEKSPPAAPAKAATSPERGWVEALRGDKPCDAPEPFARAVRRIIEAGGKAQCDASGRLVAVDLVSGRISVADADVALLVALPNLARLQLAGTEITPAAVESIVACKGLAELSLVNTQIDDEAVGKLASLPRLASLRIQRAAKLTDACIDSLLGMKTLSALALDRDQPLRRGRGEARRHGEAQAVGPARCPRITNDGIAKLAAMKNLRTLAASRLQRQRQDLRARRQTHLAHRTVDRRRRHHRRRPGAAQGPAAGGPEPVSLLQRERRRAGVPQELRQSPPADAPRHAADGHVPGRAARQEETHQPGAQRNGHQRRIAPARRRPCVAYPARTAATPPARRRTGGRRHAFEPPRRSTWKTRGSPPAQATIQNAPRGFNASRRFRTSNS